MQVTERLTGVIRGRVTAATTNLFSHAPYPLADSLSYPGDPGLFGPGSVTWPVIGDAASFIGGIRALMIQATHPEVVAGVFDHSLYKRDPLGRLSRTSAYVTATAFGAMPEVERAIEAVRRAHRPVQGISHRGLRYAADAPELAAWVHNALTDSFLTAYQVFGPEPLTRDDADCFVGEQARLGRMLDADPVPETAEQLRSWLEHHPGIGPSPGMSEALAFMAGPPLPPLSRPGYRVLFRAAAATLPDRHRGLLGLHPGPGAVSLGRGMSAFLQWSLGSSPSWYLALLRTGHPVPRGRFRRLPIPSA